MFFCALGLIEFLGLLDLYFSLNLEWFGHFSSTSFYVPFLLSFRNSNYVHIYDYMSFSLTIQGCFVHFSLSFFFCICLDHFYCFVFSPLTLFSAMCNLLLIPSVFFSSQALFSPISRSSFWIFKKSIPLLNTLLLSLSFLNKWNIVVTLLLFLCINLSSVSFLGCFLLICFPLTDHIFLFLYITGNF